jgi:hypothetical protein
MKPFGHRRCHQKARADWATLTALSVFLPDHPASATELARALAEFMFGSDEAMLRLDMSEFRRPHRRPVDRLASRL